MSLTAAAVIIFIGVVLGAISPFTLMGGLLSCMIYRRRLAFRCGLTINHGDL